MSKREQLREREIDAVFLEPQGLDEAIIGVSQDGRLVYSHALLVQAFVKACGMSEEEAVEWVEYNTIRAIPYMGDKAPLVMYELEEE